MMAAHQLRLLLAGFLLALFSSFGQTFFIALFGAEIRGELGLSHGGFGMVYSSATLASGLLMLWLGALLDRVSLRAYAAIATAVLAGACVLLATVESTLLLLLALFGLRLSGQGMMSHASVTGMARAFGRNRGKAIALASLGHPAGEAVLPIVAVTAAIALGWRNVWWLAALIVTLAVVLILYTLPRGAAGAAPGRGASSEVEPRSQTRGEMLRDPRFQLIAPALIAPAFIVTGLLFHQVHLTEVKGWDLSWFATGFVAYAMAATAAMVVAGALIDRFGAVRLMPLYLVPLTGACLSLGLGDHPLVAPVFLGLAGATSGAAVAVVTAMWAEVYGTGHLGAIRALAAAMSVVASALAPASMGWLIDAGITIEAIALGSTAYLLAANGLVALVFARPAARAGGLDKLPPGS
jgi:MFS family permease